MKGHFKLHLELSFNNEDGQIKLTFYFTIIHVFMFHEGIKGTKVSKLENLNILFIKN